MKTSLSTFTAAANEVLARYGRAPLSDADWVDLQQEGFQPDEAAAFHMACTPAADFR